MHWTGSFLSKNNFNFWCCSLEIQYICIMQLVQYRYLISTIDIDGLGAFQKRVWALKSKSLKFQCCIKIISFNIWVRYFVWNFKGTWNSTQNILPIHWKMEILFTGENLSVFEMPPPPWYFRSCGIHLRTISQEMLQDTCLWYEFETDLFKITTASPRGPLY